MRVIQDHVKVCFHVGVLLLLLLCLTLIVHIVDSTSSDRNISLSVYLLFICVPSLVQPFTISDGTVALVIRFNQI